MLTVCVLRSRMLVCVCVCTRGFTPGVLQETRTVTRRAALRTASLGNELLAKCIQPGSAVVASVTTGSTDSGMQRQRRGNCGLCAKDACALLPAFEASVRVSAMFENVFGTRTGIVADDDHRPAYDFVR